MEKGCDMKQLIILYIESFDAIQISKSPKIL